MSLPNTLAVCQAAGSLVLLGDPRQLDQPIQGVHPPGADVSALGHLLGESATVDPSRGVFLDQTWRMHRRSSSTRGGSAPNRRSAGRRWPGRGRWPGTACASFPWSIPATRTPPPRSPNASRR